MRTLAASLNSPMWLSWRALGCARFARRRRPVCAAVAVRGLAAGRAGGHGACPTGGRHPHRRHCRGLGYGPSLSCARRQALRGWQQQSSLPLPTMPTSQLAGIKGRKRFEKRFTAARMGQETASLYRANQRKDGLSMNIERGASADRFHRRRRHRGAARRRVVRHGGRRRSWESPIQISPGQPILRSAWRA